MRYFFTMSFLVDGFVSNAELARYVCRGSWSTCQESGYETVEVPNLKDACDSLFKKLLLILYMMFGAPKKVKTTLSGQSFKSNAATSLIPVPRRGKPR